MLSVPGVEFIAENGGGPVCGCASGERRNLRRLGSLAYETTPLKNTESKSEEATSSRLASCASAVGNSLARSPASRFPGCEAGFFCLLPKPARSLLAYCLRRRSAYCLRRRSAGLLMQLSNAAGHFQACDQLSIAGVPAHS